MTMEDKMTASSTSKFIEAAMTASFFAVAILISFVTGALVGDSWIEILL